MNFFIMAASFFLAAFLYASKRARILALIFIMCSPCLKINL